MEIPSPEQFSRIFGHVEKLDELPASEVPTAIGQLEKSGEPQEVLSYLRLNYALPSPPEFELNPGDPVAGRYTIREKIGAGGMGVVYRATQDRTQRDVALKLIHPRLHTRALLERFEEEIVTLGKLDHPGIVHLFDADTHDGTVFFAMQLLDGETLSRHLRDNPLTRHQKLDLIIRLCDAVQAAHTRGIIHRDIKPGNVLIDRSTGLPVVLDFGLAALAGQILADGDGQISGLSGTPDYMSPEQFLGKAGEFGAGQSIDVYALGVIAFEILAGHAPYEFPADSSWADKRRTVLESRALQLDGEPRLDEAVRKAIRKNPADRYFTANGFAKALRRIKSELASPEDITPTAWTPSAGAEIPSTDWVLEKKIGEGGIGQVWLASHPELDEKRVFKFCAVPEKIRSLKREASLFRLLKEKIGQHPNIVRLHDVSLDDPPYFIAMDHISGGDLAGWADSQGGIENIPVKTRIDIITQAATTLQAAHDAGIIHRDIKPGNLLIEQQADRVKVYIADFGIGQLLAEEDLSNTRLGFTKTIHNTDPSTGAGTHRYIAPEVESGEPATVRSDIYSLGVVLYQTLVGNFSQPITIDWYEKIEDPLIEDDLKHCFSSAPGERFTGAKQLAQNLADLDKRRQQAAARELEDSLIEKRAYRRGMMRTAGIAALIIGIVGALGILALAQSKKAKRASATASLRRAITIAESGSVAGQLQDALLDVASAASLDGESVTLRSTAAALQARDDLELVQINYALQSSPPVGLHALSPNGKWEATATSDNGIEAVIAVAALGGGNEKPWRIERASFPWIPVPEPGLMNFVSGHDLLAIAGPATSMHLIISDFKSEGVQSYLYTTDTLKCFAWHPTGTMIVSGHDDASIKIWPLEKAVSPALTHEEGDLPPVLDVPALDNPWHTLSGHRGAVTAVAFDKDGGRMASIGTGDKLRIWMNIDPQSFRLENKPKLLLEADVLPQDDSANPASLVFDGEDLIVAYTDGSAIRAKLLPSSIFKERQIGSALRDAAWSGDGNRLCAISNHHTFWLDPEHVETSVRREGIIPESVAWIESSASWALPNGKQFRHYPDPASQEDKDEASSWKPISAEEKSGTRIQSITDASGRIATYFGRRVQFSRGATPPEEDDHFDVPPTRSAFYKMVWDREGRLLTVLTRLASGMLHADCWDTSGKPTPIRSFDTGSTQVASGQDGISLIARSETRGIFSINVATGNETEIDSSRAARQDAPIAVSPRGEWIAAAIGYGNLRLTRASTLEHYADLKAPRPARSKGIFWSPDGNRIALITHDGFVQIWSLAPWRAWIGKYLQG